jgi:hypothetical protein
MTPTPHMSEAAEANLQSITCQRKDCINRSPKIILLFFTIIENNGILYSSKKMEKSYVDEPRSQL